MINIPVSIQIPELWGTQVFNKSEWGSINLIVGPNGTGKSLFADQLKTRLALNGYKPRLLNAERLAGLEKQNYSYYGGGGFTRGLNISDFNSLKRHGEDYGLSASAFVILKERLDVRIKIEALLSDIFRKTIRLIEEGGYMRPVIQNNSGGVEYDIKEKESHGLKEIITLLTFLYDDSKDCLILDEPELHIHPQFQSFFLSEIRKISGDPKVDDKKKLFFIITHSPYFIDLRNMEDLKNVLICHYGSPPSYVTALDPQDEYILKRFLPRFNTHHKQFFFSPNPVFVEGYTDQQIITLLFEQLNYNIYASGSCVIDVGGKDELAVFFRICKHLGVKARVIADLDAFFKGKLREAAQNDDKCELFIQEQGIGTNLSLLIGDLDNKLKDIADDLSTKNSTDPDVRHFIDFLLPIIKVKDKRNTVITSCLIALIKFKGKFLLEVSQSQVPNVNYVVSRFRLLLEAFKRVSIFIFPKGEIEHYYTQTTIDYLNFTDKEKITSFNAERDYLLLTTSKIDLESTYNELIPILKESVPQIKVDLSNHVQTLIVEWIQTVQRMISNGTVSDVIGLKTNAKINFDLFSQIFDVIDLNVESDKRFSCKIKLKDSITEVGTEIEFNEQTIPHTFTITI